MNTTVPNNKVTDDNYTAAESNNVVNAINSKFDGTDVPLPWGAISGTLSDQTDLQDALNAKMNQSFNGAFVGGVDILINGQVTVVCPIVSSVSRAIILTYSNINGTIGFLAALATDIVDNTHFIIKSLNPDGTVNTLDNSWVRWCVIED